MLGADVLPVRCTGMCGVLSFRIFWLKGCDFFFQWRGRIREYFSGMFVFFEEFRELSLTVELNE